MLICLGVETNLLPAGVVKQLVDERAKELEARQGFKPGRKQLRDMKDTVVTELMPRAFARRRFTRGLLDPAAGLIFVEAASSSRAEEFIEGLRDAMPDLTATLVLESSPSAAMTRWLAAGEVPGPFVIGRSVELRGAQIEKPTIRCSRLDLEGADIRRHLKAGMTVQKIELEWNNRLSFTLTAQMELKGLESEQGADNKLADNAIDADILLFAAEIGPLLSDLMVALGQSGEPS